MTTINCARDRHPSAQSTLSNAKIFPKKKFGVAVTQSGVTSAAPSTRLEPNRTFPSLVTTTIAGGRLATIKLLRQGSGTRRSHARNATCQSAAT